MAAKGPRIASPPPDLIAWLPAPDNPNRLCRREAFWIARSARAPDGCEPRERGRSLVETGAEESDTRFVSTNLDKRNARALYGDLYLPARPGRKPTSRTFS